MKSQVWAPLGEHPPNQGGEMGQRIAEQFVLVGRGRSSSRRHSTWICCTMLRSWTRNSFASLALSDNPFRAWESWLCRGEERTRSFPCPGLILVLEGLMCVQFGLGMDCSPALPSAPAVLRAGKGGLAIITDALGSGSRYLVSTSSRGIPGRSGTTHIHPGSQGEPAATSP